MTLPPVVKIWHILMFFLIAKVMCWETTPGINKEINICKFTYFVKNAKFWCFQCSKPESSTSSSCLDICYKNRACMLLSCIVNSDWLSLLHAWVVYEYLDVKRPTCPFGTTQSLAKCNRKETQQSIKLSEWFVDFMFSLIHCKYWNLFQPLFSSLLKVYLPNLSWQAKQYPIIVLVPTQK